jgi:hypothetical protein
MAQTKEPVNAIPPTHFDRILSLMSKRAELEKSISSVMQNTFNQILEAESEEKMWEADQLGMLGGRDLADVEMSIIEFGVKFSNDSSDNDDIKTIFIDKNGRKLYLLVEAVNLETGKNFTWNTSAPLLVAKIFWLEQHDKLPCECVIRATQLGGSRQVLKLHRISKRYQQV